MGRSLVVELLDLVGVGAVGPVVVDPLVVQAGAPSLESKDHEVWTMFVALITILFRLVDHVVVAKLLVKA